MSVPVPAEPPTGQFDAGELVLRRAKHRYRRSEQDSPPLEYCRPWCLAGESVLNAFTNSFLALVEQRATLRFDRPEAVVEIVSAC